MSKTFYITTTLPYVNAEPHMGHALEFVRADIIARWKKLSGYEVFFNTGTDEHGQKLFKAAEKAGMPVQEFVDQSAVSFKTLLPALGISEDVHFIRTTDPHHETAAQEFWKRVAKNGFIYKKNYQSKYCIGCEETKTDSELVDGKCPIHPNLEIETISEENYFFRFSAFSDKLLALYDAKDDAKRHHIVPDFRMNEMREFVKRGLEDFSISRLKSKMSWGVPVPDDDSHVMYVWFDALVNYISTLGWPEDAKDFERFWAKGTPTQYCGKDNTRFQSVMWQAMLLAAGLPPTHTVVVNGFVTGEGGIKMSKSLGNVVNPVDVVKEYGTDALRYFVAREISSFEDSPFTMERFKNAYNTNLANGLGNLVSRVMKMRKTYDVKPGDWLLEKSYASKALERFDIKAAIDEIWGRIDDLNKFIQENRPFEKVKTDKEGAEKDLQYLGKEVLKIGIELEPFMPAAAKAIQELVREHKMPDTPLFLRKD
ncbi:MAG TPA: methionine--tRNA ligase [Candidatus Paceibacterota bacterium]|nr:methionine--tRNA ligase [Candidatus Paceibacterota bacterium]